MNSECKSCPSEVVIKCVHFDGTYLIHHREVGRVYMCFGKGVPTWSSTMRHDAPDANIHHVLDGYSDERWASLESFLLEGTIFERYREVMLPQ